MLTHGVQNGSEGRRRGLILRSAHSSLRDARALAKDLHPVIPISSSRDLGGVNCEQVQA